MEARTPNRGQCYHCHHNRPWHCVVCIWSYLAYEIDTAKNSYHLQGRAADIVPFNRSKQTLNEWYHYLKTLKPKELIHEGTWLHVAI